MVYGDVVEKEAEDVCIREVHVEYPHLQVIVLHQGASMLGLSLGLDMVLQESINICAKYEFVNRNR